MCKCNIKPSCVSEHFCLIYSLYYTKTLQNVRIMFQVKAILVNVFGGIVNCATIANGIVKACKSIGLNLPVVVRLEGMYHFVHLPPLIQLNRWS